MKCLCFGTILNLLYQAKTSQAKQYQICGAMFSAFNTDLNTYDVSTVSHLKNGHDNVPAGLIDNAKVMSIDEAADKITTGLFPLIKQEKHKSIVRAIKAILREDTTIGDDTVVGITPGYEKKNIISLSTFTFNELIAQILYYAIVCVSNKECAGAMKEVGSDFLASFDSSTEEVYFETVQTQKLIPLKKTIKSADFSRTFEKITEGVVVGLSNPSHAHFYSVNVNNFEFKFRDLKKYLSDNLGKYVLSRAKIASLEESGHGDTATFVGFMQLINANREGITSSGSTLGEMLLYFFLEQELGAPKIMSKIEIVNLPRKTISKCDGVHLLSTVDGAFPCHQLVFGASSIDGDLTEAIDRAFDRVVHIKNNSENELQMVENTIYDNIYDAETTKYMESLIFPKAPGTDKPDMAFGAFLGYTIKLSHDGMTNQQYREAVREKMKADIEEIKPYIVRKIQDLGLEGYSFFFYVLPFNDAPNEKTQIMEEVYTGGGL